MPEVLSQSQIDALLNSMNNGGGAKEEKKEEQQIRLQHTPQVHPREAEDA